MKLSVSIDLRCFVNVIGHVTSAWLASVIGFMDPGLTPKKIVPGLIIDKIFRASPMLRVIELCFMECCSMNGRGYMLYMEC